MKTDLPQYPNFEELESDLFPAIPSTWKLKRLKFLLPEVTVGIVITPSKYYAQEGVPAIRSLNVKGGKLIGNDLVFFSKEDNEKLKKTQIHKGDVVIVRSGQTGASAVVDKHFDGNNCIDLIIVRKSNLLDSNYFQYLLMSKEIQAQVFMSSNGAIQQHFNIGLVRELLILEPPIDDQQAIVSFLDGETEKIDKLMSARREQIDILQEQRVAVIHNAVTKGLDPNTTMKPSGITWLGEIPAHWDIWRLKFLGKVTLGKMITSNDPGQGSMLKPYLKARNILWEKVDASELDEMWFSQSELRKLRLTKNDLLVSEGGEVGRTAIWRDEVPECYIQNSVHKVTIFKPNLATYFLYLFEACGKFGYFNALVNKISIAHLTREKLADISFAVPTPGEQQAIVDHIGRETTKIDALIAKYQRELELLEEYRSSLISHAVTGKIDVREHAKHSEAALAGVL